MRKVINIEEHMEVGRQKKQDAERRRLVEGFRQFLQCSSCRMKCFRCGSHLEVSMESSYPLDIPVSLCKNCREEYEEYQKSVEGVENKDILWHNQEWKAMWKLWIEYQKASRQFMNSKEVEDLLEYLTK